jgi:hypothetical protein
MVPTDGTDHRPAKYRTLRFFPFLFLGFAFIGGHGLLPLVLSLLASVLLTVGVSLLITRRRHRRFEEKQF